MFHWIPQHKTCNCSKFAKFMKMFACFNAVNGGMQNFGGGLSGL